MGDTNGPKQSWLSKTVAGLRQQSSTLDQMTPLVQTGHAVADVRFACLGTSKVGVVLGASMHPQHVLVSWWSGRRWSPLSPVSEAELAVPGPAWKRLTDAIRDLKRNGCLKIPDSPGIATTYYLVNRRLGL